MLVPAKKGGDVRLDRLDSMETSISPPKVWTNTQLLALTIAQLVFGFFILLVSYYYIEYLSPWPSADHSYTPKMFTGVCLYLALFPIAFILVNNAIVRMATLHTISQMMRAIVLLFIAIVCFVVVSFYFRWWFGYKYLAMQSDDNDRNMHMYKSLLSLEMFVLYIPFGIVLLAMAIRLIWNSVAGPKHMQNRQFNALGDISEVGPAEESDGVPVFDDPATRSLIQYNNVWLLIFLVIFIPGFYLATTLMPNDWHEMFKFMIISQAKTRSSHEAPINFVTGESLSEHTANIRLGDANHRRYMHMFTDVYIFYGVLFVMLIMGFIGNFSVAFRRVMRTMLICFRIPATRVNNSCLVTLKLGELIVFSAVGGVIIFEFIFFGWFHHFKAEDFNNRTSDFGRTFGILATIVCGLLLIPVSRGNPILTHSFGISFEGGIKYHRVLGGLFLCFAFIHIVMMVTCFSRYHPPPLHGTSLLDHYYPFSKVPWHYYHPDNFSIALMYIVAIVVIFPVFVVLSLIPSIRRWKWELFYIPHIWGSIVLIMALFFHATNGWYFMIPGVFLQFWERLYRLWVSTQPVRIMSLEQCTDPSVCKMEVSMPINYPKVSLSSYAWVNLPKISPWEWHPFSVANTLNSQTCQFFVKDNGRGTFTRSLNRLSNFASYGTTELYSNVTCAIDGPYGVEFDFSAYTHIVLIAGGIGITPLHNIFATMYDAASTGFKYQLPSVELVWIVRKSDQFLIFENTLTKFKNYDIPNMKISLFATREPHSSRNSLLSEVTIQQQASGSNVPIRWHSRKPDLEEELDHMRLRGSNGLVYACGPQPLVDTCCEFAYKNGNHFRKEAFSF